MIVKYNTNTVEIAKFLEQVIKQPSKFEMPTWKKLEDISLKSRATLWRDQSIYDLYVQAKQAKKNWAKKVGSTSTGHRRTLEEKIIYLENELRLKNKIVDAHIRSFITICRNIERLNVDPSSLLTDILADDIAAIDSLSSLKK